MYTYPKALCQTCLPAFWNTLYCPRNTHPVNGLLFAWEKF
uniref:Uncharacterized protein n=1 Tax=Anguilla anguilla TaxID=7936 RepID=A0A0E9U9V0_ANGAN